LYDDGLLSTTSSLDFATLGTFAAAAAAAALGSLAAAA
jgi:hypothetical protein